MALVIENNEWALIAQLRERIHEASARDGELGPADLALCTDMTLARYLRARQHDLERAEKMLTKTLLWRKETHPHKVVCQACIRNPRSHTFRCVGVDKMGRCVFYSSFSGIESRDADDTVAHMIQALERIFSDNGHAQSYVWVQDFAGFSTADMRSGASMSAMKLFSDHYPERLGAMIILDSGMLFNGLWRLVKNLVEVSKISFVALNKRDKIFNQLFPAAVVERLNREIEICRKPEVIAQYEWWKVAPELPIRPKNRVLRYAQI